MHDGILYSRWVTKHRPRGTCCNLLRPSPFGRSYLSNFTAVILLVIWVGIRFSCQSDVVFTGLACLLTFADGVSNVMFVLGTNVVQGQERLLLLNFQWVHH